MNTKYTLLKECDGSKLCDGMHESDELGWFLLHDIMHNYKVGDSFSIDELVAAMTTKGNEGIGYDSSAVTNLVVGGFIKRQIS